MTRTQYYQYLRRVQSLGEAGLHAEPGASRTSARALSAAHRRKVVDCALANPGLSVPRLRNELAQGGIALSAPTIRKILAGEQLGSPRARWCTLEDRLASGKKLDARQMAFVEQWNPCIALRGTIPARPGALLYQDCLALRGPDGPRFLHFAIDAATMRAFGVVQRVKRPEAAIVLLHEHVFPAVEALEPDLPPEIVTSRSSVFAGKPTHLYRVFVGLFSIRHVTVPRADRRAFAPAVRFEMTVRGHFHCATAGPGQTGEESIGERFRRWLDRYNETPQPGFPAYGQAPITLWNAAGVDSATVSVSRSPA